MYVDNTQGDCAREHIKKTLTISDDVGEVCEYLVYLMSSESCQVRDSRGLHFRNRSVLEEIEIFLRTSTVEDGS